MLKTNHKYFLQCMFFLWLLGLITKNTIDAEESLETRKSSLFDAELSCKCQDWKTCRWANQTVYTISSLPSGHVTHASFLNFFKQHICDKRTRKVYCCNDKDIPTIEKLKELRENEGEDLKKIREVSM